MNTYLPAPRRLVLACLSTLCSLGAAAADNQNVLAQFAQASGQPAPVVVKQADGSTRLSWTHTTTVDAYHASATGGGMLTPVRDGSFGRLQWQSDTRREQGEEALDWLLFGIDVSNDTSVVQHDGNISTLQAGRSTQNWRVALGDVPVEHSALGTRGEMRGLFAEHAFGKTVVSGALGVQTESWLSLAAKSRRQAPLRNAYALKLARNFSEHTSVYGTVQGYSDQSGSIAASNNLLPIERGRTLTAGVDYSMGRWKLVTEGGVSNWRSEGTDEDEHAFIVDGTWQGERATLRAGHHDIGLYYASLSADVVPGVRETYLDGSWRASDALGLAAALRSTRNDAPSQIPAAQQGPQAQKMNAVTFSGTYDFSAPKGLQLQGSLYSGRGDNFDQGDVKNSNYGLNLRYPLGNFDTGLGWQRAKLANAATPLTDATGNTLSASFGWKRPQASGQSWQLAANSQFSLQRQHFTSGTHTTSRAINLSLNASHVRWGSLQASGQFGRLRNTTSGDVLGRSFQMDASRSFGKAGNFKLYARNGRTSAQGVNASYNERVYGLQWQLAAE